MHHAGLKAFAESTQDRSGIYSYEQEGALELDSALEQRFRANSRAWNFFQSQAAWYRKAAIWWVVSAKREQTRAKRLTTLIEDSQQGRAVLHLTRILRAKD